MGKRTAGAAGEVQLSCEVRCSQVVEHVPTIEDAAAKIRKAEEDLNREKTAKRSFQFVGRVIPTQPTQLTGESLRRALSNAGHRFLSVCPPIPAYADADNELELLSAEVMTARNVLRELSRLFAGETDGELRKLSQSLIEEIDFQANTSVQLAWFALEKEIECLNQVFVSTLIIRRYLNIRSDTMSNWVKTLNKSLKRREESQQSWEVDYETARRHFAKRGQNLPANPDEVLNPPRK